MKYKTVDLCAGIGGIRRGFELTGGFKNILSAETDEYACKTYEHLYKENPKNDLTSDEFKNKFASLDYDVLLAGFPCQTFSRAGKKEGFNDEDKGTIFFHILDIIQKSKMRPKVVFLENVDHLTTHEKGQTFKTILERLTALNYKIIGVQNNADGSISYNPKDFIRNSRDFGIPQNRPRVYIIGFDAKQFPNLELPSDLPKGGKIKLYEDLNALLDKDVPEKFFMSQGYLETLKKHAKREKQKGNGFGYRIVNSEDIKHPIANTILATGGSGKERNLIWDKRNGSKFAGTLCANKKTPVNNEFIRTMTPREWGKLQGFVNYAFIDKKTNQDTFSFPKGISDTQQYKLFGNSVTIPTIREMAELILKILNKYAGRRLQKKAVFKKCDPLEK